MNLFFVNKSHFENYERIEIKRAEETRYALRTQNKHIRRRVVKLLTCLVFLAISSRRENVSEEESVGGNVIKLLS